MKDRAFSIQAKRLAFVAIVLTASTVRMSASLILNENFDELTGLFSATSAGAFTAINGTNVDIVGPDNENLCAAPTSGHCIDLNGSFGDAQGQLQSNMVFAAGSYFLSFDLIGSGRGSTASATVTFGDYDQTFTLLSGDTSSGIVVDALVTLTSPGQLLFASDTAGNVGLILDNVTVETAPSGIPEPSSGFLTASAVLAGALAWVGRRAQRRRTAGSPHPPRA